MDDYSDDYDVRDNPESKGFGDSQLAHERSSSTRKLLVIVFLALFEKRTWVNNASCIGRCLFRQRELRGYPRRELEQENYSSTTY